MRGLTMLRPSGVCGLVTLWWLAQQVAPAQTGPSSGPPTDLPKLTASANVSWEKTAPVIVPAKEASARVEATAAEPPPAADPAKTGDAPKPVETPACACPPAQPCPSFWEKNPPVRPLPRTGFFPIPPTGPGYYSLRDFATGHYREKRPIFPYSPVSFIQNSFYDADFRYLENPKNKQHDFFDFLHHRPFGNCWLFNTGGEFRYRYANEISGPRLNGSENSYDLIRTRVYGDLWYSNLLRFHVEYLDAHIFNNDQPPLAIDRNHSDLLNAFVDVRVGEFCDYPAYVRIGRQELLLGSQRLISPLDWANTRRTFQGARAFRQGEKFDVDLFWVQPVVPHPFRFDSVDNNQNFAGLFTTYRPQKGETFDLYYLFLDNTNNVTQRGIGIAPYNVHTLGSRWAGDQARCCGGPFKFLWDLEGMVQFGERGNQDTLAFAATAGTGFHYACGLNPTFWIYYDYASGDRTPNAGNYNTFNHLFPFGHLYMGWIDAVARQNVHDLNLHLYLYPTKWVTVWAQYHRFWLASDNDALYNAAGAAVRRSPAGAAGRDVGDEIDLVLNFHLGPHSDLAVGYSKLFPGDFLRGTGSGRAPELFFLQYSFRW